MRGGELVFLSVATGAFIVPAKGQEAAPSPATAPGQAESDDGIGEIIVTARKREERLQDVPVAVSSFSSEQLRTGNLATIDTLARVTPSLQINQQFGGSTSQVISLRGQAQADVLMTTDASVGLYMDGVNVPRTINVRSAMFDLERVEVLRGPQGTLYGRNTPGGAISLISRSPDYGGVHGFAQLSGGNHSTLGIEGAVNLPLAEDKATLRLAGQFRRHDGYGHNLFTNAETSDEKVGFIRGSLLLDPNDRLRIRLTGDWSSSSDGGYTPRLRTIGTSPFAGATPHITPAMIAAAVEIGALNPADIPSAANGGVPGATFVSGLIAGYAALAQYVDGSGIGFYRDASGGGTYANGLGGRIPRDYPRNGIGNHADSWGISFNIAQDVGSAQLVSTTGYRYIHKFSNVDLDATPFNILNSTQATTSRFFSQELQLTGSAWDGRLDYQGGLYYSHEKGFEYGAATALALINPVTPSVEAGDVINTSYAIYGQGTFHIAPQWALTLGGRYTGQKQELLSISRVADASTPAPGDFVCTVPVDNLVGTGCLGKASTKSSRPSWLASLDYKPTRDLLFYIKASESFRQGGLNFRATGTASILAYDPEIAREYEAGLKAGFWDNRGQFNLAAYSTRYSNIQRSISNLLPNGAVSTLTTNIARATIQGIEAELTLVPVRGLRLSGTASIIDPRYDVFTDIDPTTGLPRDRSKEDFGTFNGVPHRQLSAGARYGFRAGNGELALQGNISYQSRTPNMTADVDPTFDRKDVDVPAFTLVGARLSYAFDSGVEIALFGDNLFDKKYYTGIQPLSAIGYMLGAAGNPRMVGASVRIKFGSE